MMPEFSNPSGVLVFVLPVDFGLPYVLLREDLCLLALSSAIYYYYIDHHKYFFLYIPPPQLDEIEMLE